MTFRRLNGLISAVPVVCAALSSAGLSLAHQPARVDDIGTIHVPAFLLPESSFLGPAERLKSKATLRDQKKDAAAFKTCPAMESASPSQAPAIRKCETGAFQTSTYYKHLRARYAVTTERQQIGGVPTEVFVPAGGIATENRKRVLIDLHGGAFLGGWGINSDSESVPLAALAQMKVISIDYREGPEHTFPAASGT